MLVTYDPLMVGASVLVAILASFTGLRLASGLRYLDTPGRKVQIVKAAVALGGGIWSMHFVGMLAVQLPVAKSYDALYTLGSVLIAILFTGLSFYLIHFGVRNYIRIIGAGVLTGLGIVAMHYVGMAAIKGNCIVTYSATGIVLSTTIAILSSIGAFTLAYFKRTQLQLALGSVVLGITISSMHYSAMIFSRFMPAEDLVEIAAPLISDGYLALFVAVAAFLICGLFLHTAFPVEDIWADGAEPSLPRRAQNEIAGDAEAAGPARRTDRLPYELNKTTYFLDVDDIFSIRAQGHYTVLFDGQDSHFCPWPISRIETALRGKKILRTHRSHIVNLDHASAFRKKKDKGFLVLPGLPETYIPVSRSHVAQVRKALGV
jgi:NO-binding membrane sensor protein with MHYT domain